MKRLNLRKFGILSILVFITVFAVGCTFGGSSTDALGNDIYIIDRVAFTIFGRNIYWYALAIITGIASAYFYGMHTAKKIGFKEDDLFDGFIVGAILGIIGARLYYVIFAWNEGGFNTDPLKVVTGFINEEGGLAIHGAVLAAAIFIYFFHKKRKFDVFKLGEIVAPGFLIGQIFGRWGNFFNQEAHGGPISSTVEEGRAFLERLPIPKFIVDQMYIYEAGVTTYMHPTFLYEMVWNLIGLITILITRKFTKKYWMGDAVLFYLVWYGIGRFWIESLRTDALMFKIFGLDLRAAQVISILMIIGGVTLFVLRRIFKFHPISFSGTVEQLKN